jgi:hypothetical protein
MRGEQTMSEYVFLYRGPREGPPPSPDEAQQRMQVWMKWMKELSDQGHIKNAGQPLDVGGKVVRNFGKSITDGPYAEAKDVVLGYTIVEARDLAHAAELSKGCPIFHGGGAVEVRPVMSM